MPQGNQEKMNYEVRYLSMNKLSMRISVNNRNAMEREKLKEKQCRGLQQLCTYGLEFVRFAKYDEGSITLHLAEPSVLRLAQRVLSRSSVYDQLIDYSTYDKMGDYFLSILTIKNIELDQEPVFPVAFLVHENNEESTHAEFWTRFVLNHFNYPLPITVAKDPAIRNAVLRALADSPTSKLFFCSNKIVQDANRTFRSCGNTKELRFKSDDYKDENFLSAIENLVSCETLEKFYEMLGEFKGVWSSEYQSAFSEQFQPLIISNLERQKASNLKINAPEQSKFVLDFDLVDTEMPFCLTDLILRLHRRSCELVIEFNRFYNSPQPNPQYKVKYKFIALLKHMPIESQCLTYLEACRKADSISCVPMFEASISVYQLFHFQIADLVLNNDLIHLDESKNCYVVRSPFDETVHSVYSDDGKTNCTCPLTQLCFHRVAAKYIFENM